MESCIFGESLQVEPQSSQTGNIAGFSQSDFVAGNSDFPLEMASLCFQSLQFLPGDGKSFLLGEQSVQ